MPQNQASRYNHLFADGYLVLLNLLTAFATIAFLLGVLLPFFILEPSLGDPFFMTVVELFTGESFNPHTYSVFGGIMLLFQDGDVMIAIVLLVFSVLFPAVKLAILWRLLLRPSKNVRKTARALEMLGPWSMADVFVVSVTIVAFKEFPGGTRINIGSGYGFFLSSVVTGMFAVRLLRKRSRWPRIRGLTGRAILTKEEKGHALLLPRA